MSQSPTVRLRHSIFAAGALAISATIVTIGLITASMGYLAETKIARESVETQAFEVTDLLASQMGGAVKFGKADSIVELLEDALAKSRGSALGAVVIVQSGETLGQAQADGTSVPTAALSALAVEAVNSGQIVYGADRFTMAVPIHFGQANDTVGAIASTWTPAPFLAAAKADMLKTTAVTVLALLIGISALLFGLHRVVTRPLSRIQDVMEAMSNGDYSVVPGYTERKNEIGSIARSLETLRATLAEGQELARESAYKAEAFAASSAAMMLVDDDFVIKHVNSAATDLLGQHQDVLSRMFGDLDVSAIEGQSMDVFHSNAGEGDGISADTIRRALSKPDDLPYNGNMALDDARIELRINSVHDGDGNVLGSVVEWADVTQQRLQDAILGAIDTTQVKAEFRADGALIKCNNNLSQAMALTDEVQASINAQTEFDLSETGHGDARNAWAALLDGKPLTGRVTGARTDDTTVVFDAAFSMVTDKKGKPERVIMIGKDITVSEAEKAEARRVQEEMEARRNEVVETLSVALSRLSDGDLTAVIESQFAQDFEQLRANYNSTVNTLGKAIHGVVDIADTIRTEAAAISKTADGLSQRTEATAATVEETAAALDELTTSVTTASAGADEADKIVTGARTSAIESSEVVAQAVGAMSEIEASSVKIAKIIDVIDDIAFQTNLLALNAGVEAARAGDAGRGFAVVASEVRALAQRSSDAAGEINALISSSGTQVKRGVELVDRVGKALEMIVGSVSEISEHVTEIANSAREQSTGISEINTAMNQLDRSTQQNAALFEETTAASHSLTQVASVLNETVVQFRTGHEDDNHVPAAATRLETAAKRPAPVSQNHGNAALAVSAIADEDEDGWESF